MLIIAFLQGRVKDSGRISLRQIKIKIRRIITIIPIRNMLEYLL